MITSTLHASHTYLSLITYTCAACTHTAADTGGEFIAAYTTDLKWFHPTKWYVPADDLVQIFKMVNKPNVSASDINKCHELFLGASLAVKYAASMDYTEETDDAAFLQESYLSHPLGGLDDMAVWAGMMCGPLFECIGCYCSWDCMICMCRQTRSRVCTLRLI